MESKHAWPKIQYPLVMVLWDDASGLRHGWAAKAEVLLPQHAISVGFLIKETEEHIMIAQDTDGEGGHNGRSQIPRGMVKKIRVLRKVETKKEPDANLPVQSS